MNKILDMYQNRKFSRAAKRRKYAAIAMSILIHLGVFAAISSDSEAVKAFVPEFVKAFFEDADVAQTDLPRP